MYRCLFTSFFFESSLLILFQALAIIAFNDGNINSTTIKQVLSLGPTFVIMKLFESEILVFF